MEDDLRITVIGDKYLIDSDKHWLICYAYKLYPEATQLPPEHAYFDELLEDEEIKLNNRKDTGLEARIKLFKFDLYHNVRN